MCVCVCVCLQLVLGEYDTTKQEQEVLIFGRETALISLAHPSEAFRPKPVNFCLQKLLLYFYKIGPQYGAFIFNIYPFSITLKYSFFVSFHRLVRYFTYLFVRISQHVHVLKSKITCFLQQAFFYESASSTDGHFVEKVYKSVNQKF